MRYISIDAACCGAGITLWGRFDTDIVNTIQNLTIYLSKTPDFTLGYACVTNTAWPLRTSKRPHTFVCNSTIEDALYITIFRNTTSATDARSLVMTEVQPLRYSECAVGMFRLTCGMAGLLCGGCSD